MQRPHVRRLCRFRSCLGWYVATGAVLGLTPSVAVAQDAAAEPAAATEPAAPAATEPAAPAAAEPAAPAAAEPAAVAEPAAAAPAPEAPAAAASPAAAAAPAKPPAPKLSPSEIAIPQGHVLDASGYLLPARTVELGLFYMGYGITDWLNVGTNPGLWVIGPAVGGLVANLSLKIGFPIANLVSVGVEANPIWLRVNKDDGKVRGLVLPVTLGASLLPKANQSYTLAVRYIGIAGSDESSTSSQEIEGAALTQVVQVIGHVRFQLLRWLGVYARGTIQPWEQDFGVNGDYTADDQTRISIEGSTDATQARPWAFVAGVAFRFGPAHLRLGGGYGNIFVPRIGVFTPQYPQPDFDFFVRF